MVFVLLQAFILCVVSFVIFPELGFSSIEFVSEHLVFIYLYQVFATRLGDLFLVDPTFKHAHLLVFPKYSDLIFQLLYFLVYLIYLIVDPVLLALFVLGVLINFGVYFSFSLLALCHQLFNF